MVCGPWRQSIVQAVENQPRFRPRVKVLIGKKERACGTYADERARYG